MADVFLSYSRQDLRRAKPIIAALERAGLSVWWDRQLVGGSEFSKEIRGELDAASVVVALWSNRWMNFSDLSAVHRLATFSTFGTTSGVAAD